MKEGDKVTIRRDLKVDKMYGTNTFVIQMRDFLNKNGYKATINEINSEDEFTLKEDNETYSWTKEMLVQTPIIKGIRKKLKFNKQ